MIMVQNQPQFMPVMHTIHRRHPSAPPGFLVQPTHTPGLLSLSKPPRPSPAHNHRQQQLRSTRSPKAKPASTVAHRSPQSAQALPTQDAPKSKPDSAEKAQPLTQTAPPTPSPEKTARGRQAKSVKAGTRSASLPRRTSRQPSPPINPSQVEAPTNRSSKRKSLPVHRNHRSSTSNNAFDPFLDSDSDRPSAPPIKAPQVRTAPTLASRPSGTLAKRRGRLPQIQGSPTPAQKVAPTKAMAVPFPRSTDSFSTLSRSDPVLSHMPSSRPTARRITSKSETEWDAFPICDDTTEYGGDDSFTPPATPVRSTVVYDDGPKTAPLTKVTSSFPFTTPSPPPHRRAPSEGVFHMSLDEYSSSDNAEDLKAMFASMRRKSLADKAQLYASSLFQNSPSPDELPPPSFGALGF